MKKIAIAILTLSLMSCSDSYFVSQHTFSPSSLREISPDGLEFGKEVGKNWWEGEYKGKKVLIHAIQTDQYVSVNFQYIEAK